MAYMKRKRVYAGPPSYRKKSRFSKRRRGFARRRTGGRSSYATSSKGNAYSINFKGRTSYKKYKNLLWDASTLLNHYRSYYGATVTNTTAASSITMVTAGVAFLANTFWQSAGGAITSLSIATNSDVYIRGGISKITFNNEDTTNVAITLWRLRTSIKGTTPSTGTVTIGWDPTLQADFQQDYKVLSKKDFVLATNEVAVFNQRIRSQKMDPDMFNAGYQRDFWFWSVQSLTSGVAAVIQVTSFHNCSYTVDAI